MNKISQESISDPKILQQLDAWYWAYINKIKLVGAGFELKGHVYQIEPMRSNRKKRVYMKGAQMGYALALDTQILTPCGWNTMGNIKIGDLVYGDDGNIYPVIMTSDVMLDHECYKITFCDKTEIIADADHRWCVRNVKYNSLKVISTKNIYKTHLYRNGNRSRYSVDLCKPIIGQDKHLLIHPYLLGLWLGDGNSYSAQITATNEDAVEYSKILTLLGINHVVRHIQKKLPNISNIKLEGYNKHLSSLRLLGKGKKHIPPEYLTASFSQRMDILRGLIDTDGHIDKLGWAEFYNVNEVLADDVFSLIASLGFKPHKKRHKNSPSPSTGNTTQDIFEIGFQPNDTIRIANLERKYKRQKHIRRSRETNGRYIKKVECVGSIPVRCIGIENKSHLYLASRALVPTHNSEIEVLKTLHGMIYGRYARGVLYLFPTRDDVTDFSKGRFQPLIAENKIISTWVSDTDAANIKKVGGSMLYLRGAKSSGKIEDSKETSSQLKSLPVDKLVFDEIDEMDKTMIALAKERLSASKIQEEVQISTPTIPFYGIDKAYENSDQRRWMLKCRKCNEYTCLELEFPDCIVEKDKKHIRLCKKCRDQELFPDEGVWVPAHPDRNGEEDWAGWNISQLNSSYIDPGIILKMFNDPGKYDTTLAEVYNSKLAMAYISAENRLTKSKVYSCCGMNIMPTSSSRITAMGVDIGKMLHVVIGHKINENRYKILRVARVSEFEDLHDLVIKYNTKVVVMDMEPETRKAREFRETHTAICKVLLCDYQERLKSHEKRDEREGLLTVRRTETCDMTHDIITKQLIELPRKNPEIEEYAHEMANIAKILTEDKFTHSRTYKYRGENDHYFHSTNFFLLACRDFLINTDYDCEGDDYKQDEKQNIYNPFEYIGI